MGLDMYLSARNTYYSAEHYAPNKAEVDALRALDFLKNVPKRNDGADCIEIKVDVGYWRKANQIHNWFVENVQDGVDECQTSYVAREKLEELDKLVAEVFMSRCPTIASEKLPTAQGFFFGGTDYDEWYFEQLEYTMKLTKSLLEMSAPGGPRENWEFVYHASWRRT